MEERSVSGYAFVAKRMYRDGTEELVPDRPRVEYRFVASGKLAELMELLSQGRRDEIVRRRLHFSLAVRCLLKREYVLEVRSYCNNCFFQDICAFPQNPRWFLEKVPHARRAIMEIASKNPEIAKKLKK
ncbi:MAG: hypothetical protein DRJ38_03620 [Thermoprotei archaeon]|nr:MAG: hypothetical protein DRJ38_03620 [Thermoprotei archaeon]